MNKKIEIPMSAEDLEDLQNGGEFNWCFDNIDVHIYPGEEE